MTIDPGANDQFAFTQATSLEAGGVFQYSPQESPDQASVDSKGFLKFTQDQIIFGTPESFVFVPEHLEPGTPFLSVPLNMLWGDGTEASADAAPGSQAAWESFFTQMDGDIEGMREELLDLVNASDIMQNVEVSPSKIKPIKVP